mmetsp:Transcript_87631/g.220483  ORF Transcript_87631/g.220483 Transcript_87631/m.220483 type:complete len:338 (-) Transcript_87631:1193-2206(-)
MHGQAGACIVCCSPAAPWSRAQHGAGPSCSSNSDVHGQSSLRVWGEWDTICIPEHAELEDLGRLLPSRRHQDGLLHLALVLFRAQLDQGGDLVCGRAPVVFARVPSPRCCQRAPRVACLGSGARPALDGVLQDQADREGVGLEGREAGPAEQATLHKSEVQPWRIEVGIHGDDQVRIVRLHIRFHVAKVLVIGPLHLCEAQHCLEMARPRLAPSRGVHVIHGHGEVVLLVVEQRPRCCSGVAEVDCRIRVQAIRRCLNVHTRERRTELGVPMVQLTRKDVQGNLRDGDRHRCANIHVVEAAIALGLAISVALTYVSRREVQAAIRATAQSRRARCGG